MGARIDRKRSTDLEPFIAPKETWHGDLLTGQIQAVPGTWTAVSDEDNAPFDMGILALVCCPNCKTPSALHKAVQTIDHLGHVDPHFKCTGCEFRRDLYLDNWNDKPLYAMSVEERGRISIYYTHATTPQEARFHLGMGDFKVIAIGRAIGFFVEDKEGKVLSAD